MTRAPKKGPVKDYIDPQRLVKEAQIQHQEVYQPQNAFSDFGLPSVLLANLQERGITTPTPIQDQAILPAMEGKDIIGIANTGTGKTLAFALPILSRLMAEPNARALVLAPTRELAQQIEQEFRNVGKGSRLKSAVLIGGAAMNPQLSELRRMPQVVIGTPGRIKDHLDRGSLRLADFGVVVLDEVDRMLDMGFIHDIRLILGKLRAQRQSYFFSATLDEKVRTLISGFSRDPLTVSVKQGDSSAAVEQGVLRYEQAEDKIELLHSLLIDGTASKVIIFDDTQRLVERLSRELERRGFSVDSIHGGKSQSQRQRALARFKREEASILVATDVAARGIDVPCVGLVVNYSLPNSYEDYVHRIGRAGRAGQVGKALTFVENAYEQLHRPKPAPSRSRSFGRSQARN